MTCQGVEYQIKCSLSAIFLPKITALQETQDTKEENVKVSINFIPFNSKSDQHLISPNSNTTETLIEITGTNELIANLRSFDC